MISDMKTSIERSEDLIDDMSDSLTEIDPNTHDALEGIAFVRRMYELSGEEPLLTKAIMPETNVNCIEKVAGKVIQIDQLREDLDQIESFSTFFANLYCAAYVNSLVTMTDGMSMFAPGGLDDEVVDELQRVYGPFDDSDLDTIEIKAIDSFMEAINLGYY